MRVLLLILVLVVPTVGQIVSEPDNVRVTLGAAYQARSGVKNPVVSLGIGGDKRLSDMFTLDANVYGNYRRKIPGDGYSVSGDLSLRVGRELFGLGGISAARQHTNIYNKTTSNIFGGAGYRVPLGPESVAVLTAVYYAPDFTSPNRVQGAALKAELFLSHKVYIAPRFAAFHFKCNKGLTSTLPDRCNSGEVGIQAGFYFR